MKRIGMLTSGGDCQALNAAMRGVVKGLSENVDELEIYGQLCAWTLARAHARTGDRVAMASYLGTSDKFDASMVSFAQSYADQNEADYEQFLKRITVS